jgi:hypothetical protein
MGYDEFRRGPVKSLSLHLPRLRTLQIRNSATLPDAIVDPSSLSDDGANLKLLTSHGKSSQSTIVLLMQLRKPSFHAAKAAGGYFLSWS